MAKGADRLDVELCAPPQGAGSAGTPVILICRTAFADEGRPVEINEMTLDAASYILEYDFDA